MKITLDTDIGSDVDDLLALAMILGSPQLDLQIVTTVYGDTAFRARIVHRGKKSVRLEWSRWRSQPHARPVSDP